jgi:hypothetical protein
VLYPAVIDIGLGIAAEQAVGDSHNLDGWTVAVLERAEDLLPHAGVAVPTPGAATPTIRQSLTELLFHDLALLGLLERLRDDNSQRLVEGEDSGCDSVPMSAEYLEPDVVDAPQT